MSRILFVVACGRSKADHPAPARDLYTGAHFTYVLDGVEQEAVRTQRALGVDVAVRILSARWGLLDPDTMLAPYDTTVGDEEAIPAVMLGGQLLQLATNGTLEVSAFLPRAYLRLLRWAADECGGRAEVMVTDAYEWCRGIGEQRKVIADLAKLGPSE